ncbi:hypothetical protein KFE25_001030 [Diacronema lutheri]|uniref:Minichromosome loss protein Mcl1 middle region domain-containing protein n=1 Tax=Diacronema lutheri TaxID=2081491 RepID=A0A8J5X1B1_DIALT|nr:hypothetical protein KFE25_001030 [Diacronema lutheri]
MSKPTTRFAHMEGKTVLCYSPDGGHIITGGADHAVRVFDVSKLAAEPRAIEHHSDAVTALAISANGERLVTGCEDNMVALFDFPSGEFTGNATRSQTPVCDVAFSPTGAFVAAACDDGNIRHVAHETNQLTMLKGHRDAVLHLAYDPLGRYLASSSADGNVRIWTTDDGACAHHLLHGYGKLARGGEETSAPAWHPEGTLLAVPTPRGIRLLARGTWAADGTLSGEGSCAEQTRCAFASSGLYLAAFGLDRQLFVWDVREKHTLANVRCDAPITSLAWSPVHNALAYATADGTMAVWDGVVPSHFPHPAIATHAEHAKGGAAGGGAGGADDNEDALDAAILEALGDADADPAELAPTPAPARAAAGARAARAPPPAAAAAPPARRRLQATAEGGDDDDDVDDMLGLESKEAKAAELAELEMAIAREERLRALRDGQRAAAQPAPAPAVEASCAQASVQPGSTPWHNKRRFLAYNLLGSVTSRDEDTACTVEVTFADADRGRSLPGKVDPYHSSMAALSEDGAVFAAEAANGRPATVWYWSFASWAGNSDWLAQLPPGEEPTAVAHGFRFVAVASSARLVRVFSDTGRPLAMWTARSAVVALAAADDMLAVVEHGARGALVTDQSLVVSSYSLADARRVRRLRERPVALSEGSTLAWLGFSHDGALTAVDSAGIVRSAMSAWDYEWLPVLDTASSRKSKAERLWVIGLDETQLLCVHCKGSTAGGLDFPTVLPRPVLASLPLALPVAHVDGSPAELDAAALLLAARLEQRRDALRAAPTDDAAAEIAADVLKHVGSMDRNTLMLMQPACATSRAARALDLASQLRTPRALEASVRLAQHHRQMQLAERIALLMRVTFAGGAPSEDELLFDAPLEHGPLAAERAAARAAGGPAADEAADDEEGEGGGDEREPGWVHEQAAEAARARAASARAPMRQMQLAAGAAAGLVGGAARAQNPFAKPPSDAHAATMATPGAGKDVLGKLQALNAQPASAGAVDALGVKRKTGMTLPPGKRVSKAFG